MTLVEEMIPHRAPFLLMDSIESLSEERIHARWTLRVDDPLLAQVYAGHYPGQPITPGVLLCEAVFQAGAALMSHRLGDAPAGVPVLTRVRDAKFRAMVKPGDTVDVEAEFEEQVSNAYYLKGVLKVNGKPAVRVSFTCALVEE